MKFIVDEVPFSHTEVRQVPDEFTISEFSISSSELAGAP